MAPWIGTILTEIWLIWSIEYFTFNYFKKVNWLSNALRNQDVDMCHHYIHVSRLRTDFAMSAIE